MEPIVIVLAFIAGAVIQKIGLHAIGWAICWPGLLRMQWAWAPVRRYHLSPMLA